MMSVGLAQQDHFLVKPIINFFVCNHLIAWITHQFSSISKVLKLENNKGSVLPTYLHFSNEFEEQLPAQFRLHDVRYTPELVRYFIDAYTQAGDVVLDPFAGFGTTLKVAAEMGRRPYGVEIHQDRVEYMQSLGLDHIIHGDIRKVDLKRLPPVDFLMTSPPYMGLEDEADALAGYQYQGKYEQYLQTLSQIFERLKPRFKAQATIVVEISNLKQQHSLTTLAWDVGKILSGILEFRGEVIICWERDDQVRGSYGYGYDHSYCLVFQYLDDEKS
jgi:DNA modification methylase